MKSMLRVKYLAFSLCVITTSVNIQGPLYAQYAKNDGYGVLATTIAFAFYVLGVIPVLIGLGGISDRIGRQKIILLSLFLSALSTLIMIFFPFIKTLAFSRLMLGMGTALMSATATAYMIELLDPIDTKKATAWVTASTTIGFGLGPALTGLSLIFFRLEVPISFLLLLVSIVISFFLIINLPETVTEKPDSFKRSLRLPYFNYDILWYGLGILLCWSTTGLVLSIIPVVLERQGLSAYSGFSSMLAISCGLLFQPLARKLDSKNSSRLGILILIPAYALLAWGAINSNLISILLAAFLTSSSCYGFMYLGGLSGVIKVSGNEQARASAAFFLMGYLGFSVPVIITGLLIDKYNIKVGLIIFGIFLFLGSIFFLLKSLKK